jgi:SAM-dependent methyltransferase
MRELGPSSGKTLFGNEPFAYDAIRPDYPVELFKLLEQAGIEPGPVLEIGSGSGTATRRLLTGGFTPLLALEPDKRFAPLLEKLRNEFPSDFDVEFSSFEESMFAAESFELIVIASAYHWLDPTHRVSELYRVLRPGGRVALFWNVFQDLDKVDPFHEATAECLSALKNSPSGGSDSTPFALQRQARQAEFEQRGFQFCDLVEKRWSLVLDSTQVRSLYATFSSLLNLVQADRSRVLDRVEQIAAEQFAGRVVRNMTSIGYLFRK